MKAIVLDKLEGKTIVVTENGEFIEIDNLDNTADVGEQILIKTKQKSKKQIFRHFISSAAMFMIIVFVSYVVYGYYNPKGYVSIDINPDKAVNPNVEISYNLYGKTVKLQGINSTGNMLVKKMDKPHQETLDNVVPKVIKAAEKEKVVSQEENTIIITVTGYKQKVDDESLVIAVEHYLKDNKLKAKTILVRGENEDYKKAKQYGISPDKYLLIIQAIKSKPECKFNDLKDKSIDEIINIVNKQLKIYGYKGDAKITEDKKY